LADELSLDVPRDERGPGLSRAAVRDRFRGRISTRELEDLQVIVSELTTNALLHGDGEIHLHVVLEEGLVHGEVVDEGRGFERAVDAHGIDAVGGRGLNIVGGLARRWGIHEGSSHVWFVLAPDETTAPVAPRLGVGQRPEALDN
jgi:anti-sigma regulatory factor (Ser/Thr protein kinase)